MEASIERRAWTRVELLVVAIACVVSLVVHGALTLSHFGEPDAARIASDALRWFHLGYIEETWSRYRIHTSPMYLHLLHAALSAGVPPEQLPAWMNRANVAIGTGTLLSLYLLFRQLVPIGIAALACVFYSFTPVFFAANIYGMAHLPALGAFLGALLAFAATLNAERARSARLAYGCIAAVSMLVAVSLKADIALAGGALLGLGALAGRWSWRRPWVGAWPAVLVMGFAAAGKILYTRALMKAPADAHVLYGSRHAFVESLVHWNRTFPFDLRALFAGRDVDAFTHASGPFLHSVWLLSLLALLVAVPKSRRLLLFVFLWAFPLWFFWATKPGNSARHNLAVLPPVLLAASYFLVHLAGDVRRVALLATLILALNYYSEPRARKSIVPQSRLLGLAAELERDGLTKLRSARTFVDFTDKKKAAVCGASLPYLRFLIYASAERVQFRRHIGDVDVWMRGRHRQRIRTRYRLRRADAEELAAKFHRQGYRVWSAEFPALRTPADG